MQERKKVLGKNGWIMAGWLLLPYNFQLIKGEWLDSASLTVEPFRCDPHTQLKLKLSATSIKYPHYIQRAPLSFCAPLNATPKGKFREVLKF